MTSKRRVSDIMSAMSEGRVRPLFDAMAEDVTWRWMGVKQWTRSFNGKQTVVDTLFGGNAETLTAGHLLPRALASHHLQAG